MKNIPTPPMIETHETLQLKVVSRSKGRTAYCGLYPQIISNNMMYYVGIKQCVGEQYHNVYQTNVRLCELGQQ